MEKIGKKLVILFFIEIALFLFSFVENYIKDIAMANFNVQLLVIYKGYVVPILFGIIISIWLLAKVKSKTEVKMDVVLVAAMFVVNVILFNRGVLQNENVLYISGILLGGTSIKFLQYIIK